MGFSAQAFLESGELLPVGIKADAEKPDAQGGLGCVVHFYLGCWIFFRIQVVLDFPSRGRL